MSSGSVVDKLRVVKYVLLFTILYFCDGSPPMMFW